MRNAPKINAAASTALILGIAAVVSAPAPVLAGPGGKGGHGHMKSGDSHMKSGGGHAAATDYGMPGKASQVTRTIRVTATDNLFTLKGLKVKQGDTIRFIVANKGEIEHDFTLGDAATQKAHRVEMAKMMEKGTMMGHDDANAVMLMPNKRKALIWKFTKTGKFEFACNIPGHYESGMHGKITVIKPGAASKKGS